MATTKIIIATLPKSDQIKTFNMHSIPISRKTEILQQMAAAADARLGLPTKGSQPDTNPAPRKRQRLTHLSSEEKMMRRKLKNRVAAQTARDRKKAQMDDLESGMTVVDAKNRQLQLENALLRKQNQALLEENERLKERLQGKPQESQSVVVLDHGYCMDSTTTTTTTSTATPTTDAHSLVKTETDVEPPESAALNAPPQQELARLFLAFLSMMLTWSLTSYLGCLASSTGPQPVAPFAFSTPAKIRGERSMDEEPLCLVMRKPQHGRADRPAWWGPQQRSWNPSKN